MHDISRSESIAYRAIRRSRPEPMSWLGLPLCIGSLLLAVEFRGTIVGQMQYRERFGDAASLATIDNIILGFSTALAVTGAIIAWRVLWTFSLIGTTALGMPDVAALMAGRVSDALTRLWRGLSNSIGHLALFIKGLVPIYLRLWSPIAVCRRYVFSALAFVCHRVGLVPNC